MRKILHLLHQHTEKKIRWSTQCSMQWLQYTSLTGSGVVSPDGVVDPCPSAVVVSSSTVDVIPAVVETSIVVEATVVSTLGHCPQVFSHRAIIFGLSHLSIFVWQNSSPSLSTHWKKG